MKKNYTSPVVEVNAFDFEDVVMTSGYSLKKSATKYTENVELLKAAAGENMIVVQW